MQKVLLAIILCLAITNLFADKVKIPTKPKDPGERTFNNEQLNAFIDSKHETVISGFIANPKLHASNIQASFFAKKSERITGNFLLGNYTKKIITYKIFCLVNYIQQKCRFNKKWSFSHKVTLNIRTHKIFPVELLPLDDGAHDFLLLALRVQPLDKKDIGNRDDVDFAIISKRANIYIGNSKFPKIKYKYNILSKINIKSEQRVVINDVKTIEDFTNTQHKFKPMKFLSKYVHVGNINKNDSNAVLIGFSNLKQINISKSHNNLYFKQSKNSVSMIPIKVRLKAVPQKLTVIIIENPYIVIEPDTGKFTTAPLTVKISNTI